MGNCRSALAIAAINFRHWLKDIRVRFIFIFLAYILFNRLRPLTQYGLDSGISCTPWLMSYLFYSPMISINSMKMLLYVGMLLILCDAPFFYPAMPYMVIRSRRNGWCLGECLYIVLAAFTYTLFIQLMCVIVIHPVMNLNGEWGEVIKNMIYGSAEHTVRELNHLYEHYDLPVMAVIYLYPRSVGLYTFLTVWGACTFLGLLMYLVSLIKRNVIWGVACAGVFIFIDPFICWITLGMSWPAILSPVIWSDIEWLRFGNINRKMFLTIPMVSSVLITLIVILLVVIWRVSKKVSIELRE